MTAHLAQEVGDLLQEEEEERTLVEGANKAVACAIAELRAKQIATVHVFDGELVRVHPDGRREALGPLSPQ